MASKIDMLENGLSPSGQPLTKKSKYNVWESIGNGLKGLWNDWTGKTQNEANLGFQRENLDYEKALQQQIFNREDTSYQRTVNDMRLAGLNPLSMNGQNASGEAIATTPQNSQKTSDIQAMNEMLNVMNQLINTRNNASLSQAQSNLINQQADNQKIKNVYEADLLSNTLNGLKYDNLGKRFENEIKNIRWQNDLDNYNFNSQYGLTENMPDFVKLSALMSGSKIFNRGFMNYSGADSFGKTIQRDSDNISSDNFLEFSQLRGAIMENQLLNGLLSWLPGLGKVLGK